MEHEFKFIGELPSGYEYKLILQDSFIKIFGVAHDKSPIAFILREAELEKVV